MFKKVREFVTGKESCYKKLTTFKCCSKKEVYEDGTSSIVDYVSHEKCHLGPERPNTDATTAKKIQPKSEADTSNRYPYIYTEKEK